MNKTAIDYFSFLEKRVILRITVEELSDIYHACEMYKAECLINDHKGMYEAMKPICNKLKRKRDLLDEWFEKSHY